jgi:hypothetical protein
MWGWEVENVEVRKCCAGREVVCMVVSSVLKITKKMNLSEKDFARQKPLTRARDPSGVGGYMRKRESRELLKAIEATARSAL